MSTRRSKSSKCENRWAPGDTIKTAIARALLGREAMLIVLSKGYPWRKSLVAYTAIPYLGNRYCPPNREIQRASVGMEMVPVPVDSTGANSAPFCCAMFVGS